MIKLKELFNIHGGLFAFANPVAVLERKLNAYVFENIATLNGKPVRVIWSKRAQQAMERRQTPVIAEMQLYFSCMVKKRVLFHEQSDELETVTVNDKLRITFRPVQATSCDPVAFAKNFPVKQVLDSEAAVKMFPSVLKVDCKNACWFGEYEV